MRIQNNGAVSIKQRIFKDRIVCAEKALFSQFDKPRNDVDKIRTLRDFSFRNMMSCEFGIRNTTFVFTKGTFCRKNTRNGINPDQTVFQNPRRKTSLEINRVDYEAFQQDYF